MTAFHLASLLLLLAALFGVLNQLLLRLPHLIGVLVFALLASLVLILIDPWIPAIDLTSLARGMLASANMPRVLLEGALAFLLFAGSLNVDIGALERQRRGIFVLSTVSVVLATLLMAACMQRVFAWFGVAVPFNWCAVLGAILAPTDAVVVLALLRRVGLPEALRMLIVGESLFNDGVAVVVFLIALGTTEGTPFHFGNGHALGEIALAVGGGLLIGIVTGWIAYRAIRLVHEYTLEVTISLALVGCTYSLAQVTGTSGPIAVVTAGLLIGNHASEYARSKVSTATIVTFWSLVDEVLNALLFLMIGLELLAIERQRVLLLATLVAIPLALLVRMISVGVPLMLMHMNGVRRLRTIGILGWGGLRGGVSVALALSLPPSPYREALLTVCYGLVVFTIVVQGLTMPWVMVHVFRMPPVSPAPAGDASITPGGEGAPTASNPADETGIPAAASSPGRAPHP